MDRSPVPLRQFVLKVHSRCDLACDHCYVYEHADTSWRGRPRAVPDEVLVRTADRIAEHAAAHGTAAVHVVLHGGEPLLAGPARLRRAAEELHRALDGVCALDLRIHTNGVLLDERFLDLFAEFGVKVGISLDGDRAANDRHRRFADGRSSHPHVLRAVGLLRRPRYRHLFAGLLCTVDVRNDPAAVHDALAELDPPRVDYLLPHATWEQPPPRPGGGTPYADWLLAVLDRWHGQGRPFPVRVFDSVERTLRGGSSLTESLGLEPSDLVVVETDGTLEQADSLKTAFDGAPATGLDVFSHTFDEASRHPGMLARTQGLDGLAAECRACPVVRSCGGGLYAHRYRAGSGFANPSVYCGDLMQLITGIRDRLAAAPVPPPPQPGPPVLPEAHLDELAAGFGGAEAVRSLARAQLGIVRELLAAVRQRSADLSADRSAPAAAAWELLTALDSDAPDALDAVLAHPYTRAWAVRCLEGAAGADAGGLAEVAAAAALRAGRDEPVRVPVRGGAVRLPTLGRVLVGGDGGEAVVSGGPDGFTVAVGGAVLRIGRDDPPGDRWHPVRRLAAPGWTVALEDTDPYRDGHQWPVAGRLPDGEAEAWRAGLAEAWELIGRELPRYAPGLSAGLSTVTPLEAPAGQDVSAAARQAFGAVGIARPGRADVLALLLVHEFQHVKLGAVLDLADLHDPEDTRLHYAPWREDPRPLEGLLQGTYAHIAVADFWRVRRHTARGAAAAEAEVHFARWRRHTAEAVEVLAGSGSLTPLGMRFAEGMRATVAPWLEEPVAPEAVRGARLAAQRHREAWQARAAAGS
ncbi:FxsB family radical SAM/SPASM domain protein [Streptacidiphilus sp. ASG 303]|uniref:FxsB family cyclophane-forming radical SAM/SPASM peptide maturase n=1 Tax=Streptacidiphilus sp. ASG 303 TaxID=2896847 RepID=UPI001E4A4E42|nr:FxsB family cyclophane-forming radical SAM/SPASM peptide maturase [Streptacidiphilus sp. ASG 303]MCD0482112.1 FxsB family radical SAM/SPASM domain protein [Streptacidiphilus sp. ASG 303]